MIVTMAMIMMIIIMMTVVLVVVVSMKSTHYRKQPYGALYTYFGKY